MTPVGWEFLLTDVAAAGPAPRVPLRLRLRATLVTVRALWTYRRRGWGAARARLRATRPGPFTGLRPATAVRLARRQVLWCQLTLRAVLPGASCLPRALAFAVHLSALGLPAELCVARALTSTFVKDNFHAWTEVHGTVLGDNEDLALGYRVLERVILPSKVDK